MFVEQSCQIQNVVIQKRAAASAGRTMRCARRKPSFARTVRSRACSIVCAPSAVTTKAVKSCTWNRLPRRFLRFRNNLERSLDVESQRRHSWHWSFLSEGHSDECRSGEEIGRAHV